MGLLGLNYLNLSTNISLGKIMKTVYIIFKSFFQLTCISTLIYITYENNLYSDKKKQLIPYTKTI